MRKTAFAFQIVGLLAGFYVLCFGILAALVALDVVVIDNIGHMAAAIKLVILLFGATAAAAIVVIRGVFVSTRIQKVTGVKVSRADEPVLWQRVTDLAAAVGTRAPSDIRLVPEVNAAVWEDARLLGLIPGKRHMVIGVPLLLGLTSAQLDAVIAHELGHYSGRDTQLGGLVGRTRASVVNAVYAAHGRTRKGTTSRVRLPGADVFAHVFRGYARLVLTVTEEASRRQEYAADQVAAQIAGPAAAADALRELPVLDAAFDFYVDRYLAAGLHANLLPPPAEAFAGFAALLADPERAEELGKIRANPPEKTADKFDSHPPIKDRIAAVQAVADTDRITLAHSVGDGAAPATRILVNPAAAIAAVGVDMFGKELRNGRQVVDWDTLAHSANLHRNAERSAPLRDVASRMLGRAARLVDLPPLCAGGRFREILAALPMSEAARTAAPGGRVVREFAKTEFAAQARAWIVMELGATGRVAWRHSWAQVAGNRTLVGLTDDEIDEAVTAATAIYPDFAPLARLATSMTGVPA